MESQDWGRTGRTKEVGVECGVICTVSQLKSLLRRSGGDVVGVTSSVHAAVSQTSRSEAGQTGGRYDSPVVTR